MVLTTSGTTGAPKLVAHTLRGLVGAIAPPDRGAQPSVWATFYDIRRYGGLQIFLRAIVGGASMVFSDANEPLDEQMRRLARVASRIFPARRRAGVALSCLPSAR
jgi:acyl-coenzyme A synthetase/AMP-(fatty) acid ligase